jgi:dTDP-L-rhamnose 4-epimerase
MRVLITGGAGFIGNHLARRLLRENCEVSVLDSFSPQVHGSIRELPPDLATKVTLHTGDVRDRETLRCALRGQSVVVHLAAETGTGQSMYEVSRYEAVNVGGTASLIDVLVNDSSRTVKKIVLASSRAIYGEGKYHCDRDGAVFPQGRRTADLRAGQYEPVCPVCGQPGQAVPTPEDSPLRPTSFYGLTKQVQEQMVMMFARVIGLSAFALRYQNVYGPGQSLRNPYTGILAIFANQARINQPIFVFEDGQESRDFVYIEDVIEATWRCIQADKPAVEALNVGSGRKSSVREVAQEVVCLLRSTSSIEIDGSFREGDIRHNYADIGKAKLMIQFEPHWTFQDGLQEFLRWVQSQELCPPVYESSLMETRERGMLHV